jgi:ubiquinone/menaquinone biosynthesis C-methylase UbiE
MIERDVFATDQYVEHFKPDQARSPFRAIYAAKRNDVLADVRHDLPTGGTVLDLGGGMGRMAVPLAQDYRVTLCDVSGEMLRLAEKTASEHGIPNDNLTTHRLNASNPLPFSASSFDCILSVDLLVHLPDPVATLCEVRRVLKPNGHLLVDVTNSTPWWLLRYPRYVGRQPRRWLQTWQAGGVLPEWQKVVRHYRRDEFVGMLTSAGFSVSNEWCYGPTWCPKWILARCRYLEP